MWERWDAIRPDGTIDVENAGMMLSFKPLRLRWRGAGSTVRRRVLRATAPGYRTLEIAPRPGGTLTSAGTSIVTRTARTVAG
ncbi:hypothetical protein [Streptomyces stelliscabiei]|uniref:hypothetical protein n=1 Tax=Streptomyces stelliscabiei TaxID=146820 RepID=UPI002FF2A310